MQKINSLDFLPAFEAFAHKSTKDLNQIGPLLSSFELEQFDYQQIIHWHGLKVVLNLQSESFLGEVKNYFPQDWLRASESLQQEVQVYIFDDQKNSIHSSFWNDTDPNCHLYTNEDDEWACQRDFVAKKNKNKVVAVCKNNVSDGFFNLMRWILPRFWLSQNQFLFHSSCVLNNNEEAYLCLGPSGAGKTTISKFLPESQVLGDDMNLLTITDDGKALVTPSLLGQSYESDSLFGKSFPLKQIFWITKSDENKIIENKNLSLRLKTCMSLVNIFWQHLDEESVNSVQYVISTLNKNYDIKELKFSLNRGVWDYVFSKI